MLQLNPYVRFEGTCREGMTFYQECFGGELSFQTVGESPMAKDMPKEKHGLVMHASLKGPVTMFGGDMMRDKMQVGDNVVLSLNSDKEEDIKRYFEKLSRGGEVFMPLQKVFWGPMFGMLTDKYGVEWMFNVEA